MDDTTRIVDNPERSRFELWCDGELMGRAEYRLRPDDRIVLTHTETDEAVRGRGLAGRLAREVLESAKQRGLTVTPLCPYMVEYIRRHPEYVPLVDERHRASVTGEE